MEPPASSLWRAVHQQAVDGIDLVADIEADRANRRRVTQPGANRVPEIAQREPARALPHVAAVQKQDAAEFAAQRRPDFFAEREHAVAANRQARSAERAHFVAAPAANARCPAEKIFLRERDIHLILTERADVPELQPARQDHGLADDGKVVTAVDRRRRVAEWA